MASSGFMPSAVALMTISHPCGSAAPNRARQPVVSATDLARLISATLVNVEYGKRLGAGGRDGKCDGAARAAGANQKNRFVCRVITFPLHAEHATEAIERGPDPPTILGATNDIDCADLTSRRMQFVDKRQHALLMRHA